MAKRSMFVGLALAMALGGCAFFTDKQVAAPAFAPGWYLERTRILLVTGPRIFAGPFTYEQCEAKRMEFDQNTARGLLCIMERTSPGPYGPYPGTVT
jgi:hypothetical protein